jgi:hypothetical protein
MKLISVETLEETNFLIKWRSNLCNLIGHSDAKF